RYWLPVPSVKAQQPSAAAIEACLLHPLLHQNTSDLTKQRFSSVFTGREFFLSDHQVNGERILPGVAYFEMVRAAVELAAGELRAERSRIRIRSLTWIRPITVADAPVSIHVGLVPEENGEISVEIYGEGREAGADLVLHCKSKATFIDSDARPALDIQDLKAQCGVAALTSDQCYEISKSRDYYYGPGLRGIERVHVGFQQVLAKLSLPFSIEDTAEQFVLHPTLLDSALQAAIGLIVNPEDLAGSGNAEKLKTVLPFAVQELEIVGACESSMWAWIRYSEGCTAQDKVQKIDVDYYDHEGNLCIRMIGLSARVMEQEPNNGATTARDKMETPAPTNWAAGSHNLVPVWDTVPVTARNRWPEPADRVLMIGCVGEDSSSIREQYMNAKHLNPASFASASELSRQLKELDSIDHIVWASSQRSRPSVTDEALIDGQEQGVLQLFRLVKALLESGYGTKNLGWTIVTTQAQPVHPSESVNPADASVHGLVGTMAKEYPAWKIRLMDLESGGEWPVSEMLEMDSEEQGDSWAYRGGEWFKRQLIPQTMADHPEKSLYKAGGVYVVIGGAGGIGEVWSEYMIRTYQARVVWIGRSKGSAALQRKLDRLASFGPAPFYISADARDRDALQQAYREIKERYGHIDGVIHSAIVLLDKSLANMEEEQFRAGIAAKADVSVRLAQVFNGEPLDFVLFFSSLNSFLKPPGQSNYSAGCVFKDAFAHQLSLEWACPVKVMNWGYWGNAGVVASKEYQDRMAQAGIGSIESEEAMAALETLLAGRVRQMALMKTTRPLSLKGVRNEERLEVNAQFTPSLIREMRMTMVDDTGIRRIQKDLIEKSEKMGQLLLDLLWSQLQSAGWFLEESGDIAALKLKTGLPDMYERWLKESIALFVRKGFLQSDGFTYTVMKTEPAEMTAQWMEWNRQKELWIADPNMKAQVLLVEAVLQNLPEIVSGRSLATDIIFPGGSMDLVEGIYKHNAIADYYNEALADHVVAYVQARAKLDPKAKIRILEIGAGTGGTSSMVFRKLKSVEQYVQEYTYTDLSKAFLHHAEKEYGPDYPYLTYRLFNTEEPVAGQGIATGTYDLVIAANVMHATPNIRQSVRNAKAALKTNGLLLLNELASNSLFTHLTFGLLKGWWLYEDSKLRIPGSPGLSPQTWERVLEGEGYHCVYFPAASAHKLGQQIIIAESDGILRLQAAQLSADGVSQGDAAQSASQHIRKEKLMTNEISRRPETIKHTAADHVRLVIRENLSSLLKMEEGEIQDEQSFSDYGLDSITGVHFVKVLNDSLGIEIETIALFDYSSVSQLTGFILSEHSAAILDKLAPAETAISVKAPNGPSADQFATAERSPFLAASLESEQDASAENERLTMYIRGIVMDHLSEALKLDAKEIDPGRPFADYGLDSITGVHMVKLINDTLAIELESIALFDYSSVYKLAEFIYSQYGGKVAGYTANQAARQEALKVYSEREEIARPAIAAGSRFIRRGERPVLTTGGGEETAGSPIHKGPIAVIGMSGRFAKSKSLNEFWNHLSSGTNLVGEVSRWDLSKYFPEGSDYCKYGSFLDDIDKFDPLFFNISGLEASYMDPQQRIFLEESWKALEDAGYAGEGVGNRKCGIYLGYTGGDYVHLLGENPPAHAFMGNSGSIIPARIAYYLNLKGPAVTVDTACSSSLVAIHLACQGLWTGETEMALAGGVSIQTTAGFYQSYNGMGMLSPTGRCQTFDDRADGFVPGEAVGAVVLKRLEDAIADGDHIYGVIRGSGMNQDGTTNGMTAPSAISQERLEREVYENFAINPENIQMVEAHGTGTKLGDPIEYHALSRAFRKYTDKTEFCAIGSVKTNIGHAAAAAGVSGFIKVLLALRHKQIPPTLHFESGNSNIQFEKSPFYVNSSLKDWNTSGSVKRCAALSSFGFSGTNVHLVIEEAPKLMRKPAEKPGYLIVLSGRTFEALREQAAQLQEFCLSELMVNCGNMSYTLMQGRRHFQYRLACVISSVGELEDVLGIWLKKGKTAKVLVSQVKENEHREQASLKRYGNQCIEHCRSVRDGSDYLEQLSTVAELFVQGYALNYSGLFANDRYCRVPLPTYPFERERYWVEEQEEPLTAVDRNSGALAAASILHPLVHQNTSDFSEQRYSSTFSGEEFFLTDHKVNGRKVLPGVAYLEMAHAAISQASGESKEQGNGVLLKNVVWARPIIVEEHPVLVHIALSREISGEISYEIFTEDGGGDWMVHSQGSAQVQAIAEASLMDISLIKAKCAEGIVTAEQCYNAFNSIGMEYGPGHKAITELYLGKNQVLAKLSLPKSVTQRQDRYVLHPSLMDAALQAPIGLIMNGFHMDGTGNPEQHKPILPYAVEEVQIIRPCVPEMWAHVRMDETIPATRQIQKYNLDLCDESGRVCV
ncbi:SDR family NAD(P)-dependent oxidoreductase, partial [Paenibacillus forsythiae]